MADVFMQKAPELLLCDALLKSASVGFPWKMVRIFHIEHHLNGLLQ